MEEDITTEINKIISYCRARECEECKYLIEGEFERFNICALHNPSAWEV
jgi:hypothetical protein